MSYSVKAENNDDLVISTEPADTVVYFDCPCGEEYITLSYAQGWDEANCPNCGATYEVQVDYTIIVTQNGKRLAQL